MRLSFRLGLVALCLLAPSIATADDSGWYVGIDPGRMTATPPPQGLSLNYDFEDGLSLPDDPALKITQSSSLSSTSRRVEGGYWFNSYVGLQASYLDMGTFSQSVHYQDPHKNICYYDCSFNSSSDVTDTNKVRVKGLVLAVTGRVPLPDEFELLVRLGAFSGSATFEEDSTGFASGQFGSSSTIDTSSGDFGLGLGWRFSSHWGVELWRDRFTNLGNSMGSNSSRYVQFDVKGYSLAGHPISLLNS